MGLLAVADTGGLMPRSVILVALIGCDGGRLAGLRDGTVSVVPLLQPGWLRRASRRLRPGETEPAVLLNLFLIGLAIALDPLPLTAFMVILPSQRGVRKGAAWVFGWLVSLAIVVAVTVIATGNNPPKPNTAPSQASLAVRAAIGAGLVAVAIRQRRRTGRPKKPKKPPKWQGHVDSMSPWFAMALAPALQPWTLIGAGAATVVEAKLSSWESFLALFLYCVLATASYLAMEIYAAFKPGPSQAFWPGSGPGCRPTPTR